jgi:hypothetical protein
MTPELAQMTAPVTSHESGDLLRARPLPEPAHLIGLQLPAHQQRILIAAEPMTDVATTASDLLEERAVDSSADCMGIGAQIVRLRVGAGWRR